MVSYADLDEFIKPDATTADIESLREAWLKDDNNYEKLLQLSIVLTRSATLQDKQDAICHFDYLIATNIYVEESLYYLSIVYYSLNQYEHARKFCERLYRMQPDSPQVKGLHAAISAKYDEKKKQDQQQLQNTAVTAGLMTLALSGVALAAVLLTKKR